jgi:hypothetical protein
VLAPKRSTPAAFRFGACFHARTVNPCGSATAANRL